MWISDPHQNLHSCVSHPVDWGPYLLWKSPSLILFWFLFLIFSAIFLRKKAAEKSEQKIGTKIGTEIGTPSRGSAVWVCKLIPCVLASGLWFSDKSQRNEQLLETCLCCASVFCIATARLNHIAPWLQWISLSKKNFGNQKNRGKIGTATCFHQNLVQVCCATKLVWSKFGPFGSYYLVQVCFFSKTPIAKKHYKNRGFSPFLGEKNCAQKFWKLLSGPSWRFLRRSQLGPDNNFQLGPDNNFQKCHFFVIFCFEKCAKMPIFIVFFEKQPKNAKKIAKKKR